MRYRFGSFSPDIGDIGTDTLDIARNIVPGRNSWLPFPMPVPISSALAAAPRGLFFAQKSDGTYRVFAGTAAKLYEFDTGTQGWTDVTRASGGDYTVADGDFWSGVQFGNRLIVTQESDAVQYIDLDSGTAFAALPNAPACRFISVMDDKVIAVSLASNHRTIQWSDVNDSETWSTGSGSLAGNQEFADAGAVQGFFPNARTVMLERGLRAVISTGDVTSFQFPPLAVQKGTTAPHSAVELGTSVFWLSDDDFYIGNAEQQQGIGAKRFIAYFLDRANLARQYQIYSTFDPFASRFYCAYPTGDTAYNDSVIGWDWQLGEAFELEVDTYVLGRIAQPGFTLATLEAAGYTTIALMPAPFGSRLFMGGQPLFATFGTDLKLATFSGTALAATIRTGTYEFNEERLSRLKSVAAFVEGEDADDWTIQVAPRKTLDQTISFGAAKSRQASGRYRFNDEGAFHTLQFNAPAGIWKHAQGFRPMAIPTSQR